jgi:hypothetical protein
MKTCQDSVECSAEEDACEGSWRYKISGDAVAELQAPGAISERWSAYCLIICSARVNDATAASIHNPRLRIPITLLYLLPIVTTHDII